MEVIRGAHCIDDDIGERTGIETFNLDMLAEGSEVAIESAQLGGVVGVFGMFEWWMVVRELRVLHHRQDE